MTAIYARQSIDKKDSISIETQIDFCKKHCNEDYRVYSDKGWSGKNLDRPQFKQLIADIKNGEINKLVVYKLDRISRSLSDFSGLMELFKKHGVEFASTVETFDTSTPIGRAMLGIIMVFAELERENIMLRVKDNYYARGEKGMYLGGVPIYGFNKIQAKVGNVRTAQLIPNESMNVVEYMYKAYSDSHSSLGDIVKYLNESGIPSPNDTLWDSCKVSRLLRSPTYVRADMEVYKYFKEKGAKISNPIEDFTGERGCFLYGKREANERKYTDVHDHVLSLGLHEGVISPELWLTVQHKLDRNNQIKKGKSGTYSWLSGLIKCGKCGYAMRVMSGKYFYCSGKANHHACEGIDGKPDIESVEAAVYNELKKRFEEIKELVIDSRKQTADPRVNKLKMELESLNQQVDNLVDKIATTSAVIGKVLEEKLEKLITERTRIEAEMDKLSDNSDQKARYEEIIGMIEDFNNLPLYTRREIAKQFITRVEITEERVRVGWRF